MPVNVQGDGGLFFDSGIDLTGLEADAKKADAVIANIGKSVPVPQFQSLNTELGKVKNSIETLRAMKLAKESFLIGETDIAKIAKYRKEITALDTEITKLSNIGREGFDQYGNAIPKALKAAGDEAGKTTSKFNFLTKGFSFFRQAAYLIPGIGIAGIFNLIGEGVAALVTQLFKGGDAVKIFARNFENLKEVMANANKEAGRQIDDLKILYTAATNANLSLKDRKDAIVALKAEFPDFFKGLNDEIILQGKAKDAYDNATIAILNQSRAKAAKAKLDDLEAQRLDVAFQKQKIINATNAENKRIDRTVTQIVDEKGNIVGGVGGIISIQQQEAAIAKRKSDALAQEDLRDKKLNEEEKFLIAFVGEKAITKVVVDENQKRIDANKRANEKNESEILRLLNERKSLLDAISGKERDAFQSGLVKEASAVDKLKESYDILIKSVNEHNEKAKKKGLDPISLTPILKAQDIEVSNTMQKQQADEYIKSVDKQKDAFDRFEKYKLSVGPKNAKQILGEELKGFDSYIAFLQTRLEELANDNSIGAQIKKNALNKLLEQAKTDKSKTDQEEQAKNLEQVLSLTSRFEFQKDQIEQRFAKLRQALQRSETTMTKEEFQKRSDELERLHQQELTNLNNSTTKAGELYRKLGEDLVNFTKDQLKQRLADLKDTLKNNTSLTPQMKKDVKSAIDSLEGLLASTDETINKLNEFFKKGTEIKNAFDGLADAVTPINSKLGDSLKLASSLLGQVLNVSKALSDFKAAKDKGDIIGQITSITGIISAVTTAISFIVNKIKDAVKAAKEARDQVREFNNQLIAGEIEYQLLLRERQRQIITNNKLTIEGIEAQNKLLSDQRNQNQQSFNDILAQIQKESFVVSEKQGKKSLFSSKSLKDLLGGKIETITESLAGKTFDELEQLFTKGQLAGKAKDLFLQLQKLHDEGVDIDQQLEDLKKKSAAVFTGTTADSLRDSLIQMFRDGKTGVSDFADFFKNAMRDAALSIFEFKFLEPKIKDFFDQFSSAAESGGTLTKTEIADLQSKFNQYMKEASKQFESLKQVTGLDFGTGIGTSNQNVLVGQFQQMTEDTGNVLVGAFNGQRLATLQLVDIQKNALTRLNNIETNTAATVMELKNVVGILKDAQTGAQRLKVTI